MEQGRASAKSTTGNEKDTLVRLHQILHQRINSRNNTVGKNGGLLARSWQDRITAILVMPFIGASLVAGVAIYFVMVLNFSWFQGVFGTKGGGPLGVVLFAFSFSLAGGFAGYRCVRLARRLRR